MEDTEMAGPSATGNPGGAMGTSSVTNTGALSMGGTNTSKNLSVDYTGVFHSKIGQEGFAFEHELVQFIHSILVEEPLIIDQIH